MITKDILAIKLNGSEINVDDLDPRENYPKPEPVEQIKKIEISGKGRTTQIRTLLNKDQKKEMRQFLKEILMFLPGRQQRCQVFIPL